MEIKRDKVVGVQGRGTFESQYGADLGNGKKGFYNFEIAFANGDVGQYSSKNKDQQAFVIDGEADYEWHDGQYPKVKKVKDNNFQGGGGRKVDPVFEKKRQIMIILQSSLTRAMEFHTSNGYECSASDDTIPWLDDKKKETVETMNYFANEIMKNQYLK